MNVNDLLADLHPETIMKIWGDENITNVYNVGNGLYTFDTHILSHGELITSRASVKVQALIDGEIQLVLINTLELCRTGLH